MSEPRLLDCRKSTGRMGSMAFRPSPDGRSGYISAHEGRKPLPGDYLALDHPKGGMALYRVMESDWCMNVDPANMWTASVDFIPGREARALSDLPRKFTA